MKTYTLTFDSPEAEAKLLAFVSTLPDAKVFTSELPHTCVGGLSAEMIAQLEAADAEVAEGKFVTLEQLEEEMKSW